MRNGEKPSIEEWDDDGYGALEKTPDFDPKRAKMTVINEKIKRNNRVKAYILGAIIAGLSALPLTLGTLGNALKEKENADALNRVSNEEAIRDIQGLIGRSEGCELTAKVGDAWMMSTGRNTEGELVKHTYGSSTSTADLNSAIVTWVGKDGGIYSMTNDGSGWRAFSVNEDGSKMFDFNTLETNEDHTDDGKSSGIGGLTLEDVEALLNQDQQT